MYDASLAITTHNRKDELRAALDSALAQSLADRLQLVVIDDGSTDGTSDMLRAEYGGRANVVLDAQHPGIGLIAERNRFPELCDAPIIFSMDDDAVFPSTRTIEQTLDVFNASPRVGVVAMPYEDVNIRPGVIQQQAPSSPPGGLFAAEQYRGTAHAIRKDLFVRLGRYRGQLWRQGEEGDYAIRLYDSGHAVVLGSADPIHHLESPKRSKPAIYTFTTRNNVWFAWHNVPGADLPRHLLGTTLMHLRDAALHPPRTWPRFRGLIQGYAGVISSQRTERRPVSREAYRLSRSLRRSGPVPLADIEAQLAAMQPAPGP
ncbi:MAG: glycosyltransferase family A protein [Planctomycetota bacterium]